MCIYLQHLDLGQAGIRIGIGSTNEMLQRELNRGGGQSSRPICNDFLNSEIGRRIREGRRPAAGVPFNLRKTGQLFPDIPLVSDTLLVRVIDTL